MNEDRLQNLISLVNKALITINNTDSKVVMIVLLIFSSIALHDFNNFLNITSNKIKYKCQDR